MKIKVKKLHDNAQLPTRGSDFAAGYDVTAAIDAPITIAPRETIKIGTGLAFELPNDYFVGIYARSGLATKHGLRPANCCGIVDSDYRGECIVALHNDSREEYTIQPGERIAQIILQKFTPMVFEEADELEESKRGTGGFGSTGKGTKE